MSQAVKRACDACHRRKVKCDGINPCRNCSSAQLSCTYNAIPQKKGPKGSRAKVISELRETQRQISLSAKVQNRINGIPCPPSSPTLGPTPGLLTTELVKECAHFFFDNLYPQLPILDRRQFEQLIPYMDQNRDTYCLMASLCAFVMLQPGMSMPPGDAYSLDMMPGANIISSQLLIEETLRVRKGYEYLDSITHNALATNFFLFGCFYGQEMHDRAWYILREGTTMIHLIGMHKEEYYMQFEGPEASRRRRLYWLYFILERTYVIDRQHPHTLSATISLSSQSDDPMDPHAHQLNSFVLLASLYHPFDGPLMTKWDMTRNHLSPQLLTGLQKQLDEIVQSYSFQDANFDDLAINQQWLKTAVWQLSSGAPNVSTNDSMPFQFPPNISRQMLLSMVSQFPAQADGIDRDLIVTLLETTGMVMDFLSMQAPSRDPFALGPREHLSQIVSMVAMSRNGDHRFLPLLFHKISELLPRIASPMLQNAPEDATISGLDLFDGFGTAGMAQLPDQLQVSMSADLDRKFSIDDFGKRHAMDLSGTRPESATKSCTSKESPCLAQQSPSEISDSLVASQTLTSPGLDCVSKGFPCSPTPDMVLCPIAHHTQASTMSLGQSQQHTEAVYGGMSQHAAVISPKNMCSQPMKIMGVPTSRSINFSTRTPHRPIGFSMHMAPTLQSIGDFHDNQGPNSARSNSIARMELLRNELKFAGLR